ncbi:MAG: molybdopterin-binding protein, partial [Turicibacter sp.]
MKKIKTIDAVGHVLCHDITQIIKDVKDGPVFKKGHVVREEDIEVLLSVGKDHLYIYEADESMLHENDAADILYNVCKNDYMKPTEVKEGKIEVIATEGGLLKVDIDRLQQINEIGEIIIATRHNNTVIKANDKLAGTRIIPLMIHKDKLEQVKAIHNEQPLLEIKPFHHFKVGVITTGNEVYYGRIKDTFTPVIKNKLAKYNLEINHHIIVNDDIEKIQAAISECRDLGMELIICIG